VNKRRGHRGNLVPLKKNEFLVNVKKSDYKKKLK
jgi:hypothetical protein